MSKIDLMYYMQLLANSVFKKCPLLHSLALHINMPLYCTKIIQAVRIFVLYMISTVRVCYFHNTWYNNFYFQIHLLIYFINFYKNILTIFFLSSRIERT